MILFLAKSFDSVPKKAGESLFFFVQDSVSGILNFSPATHDCSQLLECTLDQSPKSFIALTYSPPEYFTANNSNHTNSDTNNILRNRNRTD